MFVDDNKLVLLTSQIKKVIAIANKCVEKCP